jgi:hypothetical protein
MEMKWNDNFAGNLMGGDHFGGLVSMLCTIKIRVQKNGYELVN